MVTTLNWFEIPAKDFKRAKAFYARVLDVQVQDDPTPNRQYAYLPADPKSGGFGGAIACGENYVPATTGTTIYLDGGNDLSVPLGRVASAGGHCTAVAWPSCRDASLLLGICCRVLL